MGSYPIIFLDVDGVLNSLRWFHSADYHALKENYAASNTDTAVVLWRTHFDPAQVAMLKKILDETGARIVLSSTWRLLDVTRAAFAMNRVAIPNLMKLWVGNTPRMKGRRGDDIDQWIRSMDFKGPFVIIDDDSDMEPHSDKLVQTDPGNGLMKKHVAEIISRLTLPAVRQPAD